MKDLLPIISLLIFLIALLLIFKINKEGKLIREDIAEKDKEKKKKELELYESLKGIINVQSLTIVFQIIKFDKGASIKLSQLSQEIKSLRGIEGEEEEVLELRNDLDFQISNNILELDDTLDLMLNKIRAIKASKGIDDDEEAALIE